MSTLLIVHLPDRGVVAVTGPDAAAFLQGLLTNDMGLLDRQPALHAGLLSPQGKILFDFFVVKRPDGFLLEVPRALAGDLVKRLSLYKLRARIELRDLSAEQAVFAAWGDGVPTPPEGALRFPDPRLPALGERWIVPASAAGALPDPGHAAESYHAHRIAHGVPEGGKDYAYGDAFPHEALFDQLHGVSFQKGCYVGQEVVSRMQHRGTARKRIVPVVAGASLPAPGTEIVAGASSVGMLASTADRSGLAMIRLDRAAEATAKGEPLTAAGIAVVIRLPAYARFGLQSGADQR